MASTVTLVTADGKRFRVATVGQRLHGPSIRAITRLRDIVIDGIVHPEDSNGWYRPRMLEHMYLHGSCSI